LALKGHGFKACPEPVEGCRKDRRISRALQAAEKLRFLPKNLCFVTGQDFSRAVSTAKSTRASAPAGRFSETSLEIRPFSAACLAPEGMLLPLYHQEKFSNRKKATNDGSGEILRCRRLLWVY
jgi:hypothetical protein